MKHPLINATLFLALAGAMALGCKKESPVPSVTTSEATQVTSTSARSTCTVTDDGGSDVTALGLCLSISPNPTVSDSVVSGRSDANTFYGVASRLRGGTLYYLRGYATSSAGTGYGNTVTFNTLPAVRPEVKGLAPVRITQTLAELSGEVTSDGGAAITARGLCWGTSENPTVVDSKMGIGSSMGRFAYTLTGLIRSTTYYARAYATNSVGISYSGNIVIRTMYGSVTDIDGNAYQTTLIGDQEWMAENLKVTHYRNGDAIPNITDDALWRSASGGAWCSYENEAENRDEYGLLYNQYTVADSRWLCPSGWHVPNYNEWETLFSQLGGIDNAGYKLRRAGMDQYDTLSTNSSGFTALLGGTRNWLMIGFQYINAVGFWCDTGRCGLWLEYKAYHFSGHYTLATSVRCLKDN